MVCSHLSKRARGARLRTNFRTTLRAVRVFDIMKKKGGTAMFLTRKSLKKINLLTGAYLVWGAFCFIVSVVFALLSIEYVPLIVIGVFSIAFGALVRVSGKYAEGKGKLINSGNKLVHMELRPAEFIRLYEEKRDSPDNVISSPDFDVLSLVVTAYDALGDSESALTTLDQIISIAPDKKRPLAKIIRASILYSVGRIEEAEQLYREVQNEEMDYMAKAVLDVMLKCDRAMALGDYTTAEAYNKQLLARTFPKNTPLTVLYAHFALAKIYCATERLEQAKVHLNYCVENGGETAIKSDAVDMLNI